MNCPDTCPLYSKRQAVLGKGPSDACIALIGEAPGQEEHKTGVPFIGPAGKILQRSLRDLGLERENLYITNTVKCFPTDFQGRKITPTQKTITTCSKAHLFEELASLPNLKLIVTLGAIARKAVFGVSGSMKVELRKVQLGLLADTDYVLGMSLIHPAATLHNPMITPRYEDGFRKLRKLVKELGL